MLPLDDPLWRELDHRGWANNAAYPAGSDSPFIPTQLAALLANPHDRERFGNLWPFLCSEGTTWDAAFAAAPYIVEVAAQLEPSERFEHLYVIGLMVMCMPTWDLSRWEGHIPDELKEPFRAAVAKALRLLTETLLEPLDRMALQYSLAAVAALKGEGKLANTIDAIDIIES